MSQYQVISICQRTINIINCAQEGALWINKLSSKEKNTYFFQHQGYMDKMNSEYDENHVWISTHVNNLDQGVVLSDIWLNCSCVN